jgi:hypothetical protein
MLVELKKKIFAQILPKYKDKMIFRVKVKQFKFNEENEHAQAMIS